MFLFTKIKASALQVVLVVAVIIVLLLFAFISLIYIQKRVSIKHSNYAESIYANQQAFYYLNSSKIRYGLTDSIAVFSPNTFSSIIKKQWGLFELVTIKTRINEEVFEQIALIGERNTDRKALYLKNNNQALILVGNTTITGNVSVPSLGVNSGNIGGVSYNKEKLIYGDIEQSDTKIPVVSNQLIIESFLNSYAGDTLEQFDLKEYESLNNSFRQKTLIYQKNGVIDLIDIHLTGNIIIESDTLIRVDSSATLDHVILIAPNIEVQSGFKGSFQGFAKINILVKENVQLEYPTSLVLQGNEGNGKIHISKESTIKGALVYISSLEQSNYKVQILLDNQSKVVGEVYCQGNLELRGEVFGSVYTNSFIANQSGGIYINHIYNGVINSEKLPNQYLGLMFNDLFKGVAKWVY